MLRIEPAPGEFVKEARPGVRSVVWAELDPGSTTPGRALAAISSWNAPFLLESASGPETTGRYSFLGCSPFLLLRSKNDRVEVWGRDGAVRVLCPANPVHELRRLLAAEGMRRRAGLPPFFGGAVGYFSYDIKNFLERLPDTVEDDLGVPDAVFGFYDTVAVFDRFQLSLKVISTVVVEEDPARAYRKAAEKVEELAGLITAGPEATGEAEVPFSIGPISSTHDLEGYSRMVARAKEYITAGDIYQANLSQRLSVPFSGDTRVLYEVLKQINPSPFAFHFDYGDFQVVSCSPERLVRLQGNRVDTRPIAGTRPRGSTESEDEALAQELILHPKERAEHVMIVDMSRNDIGRVCEFGTVRPDEFMILEPYSHVIHIVTNVTGKLRPQCDALDLFSAAFPGASITGVPKIRCMEIVDELETVRRGLYTGSAGWISFAGDMDLNIIIRTFVIKDGLAHVQVGGGIVADSDPSSEYEETLHKGRALVEALRKVSGTPVPGTQVPSHFGEKGRA